MWKRRVIPRLFASIHPSISLYLSISLSFSCPVLAYFFVSLSSHHTLVYLQIVPGAELLVITPHHHNIFFCVCVCLGSWVNQGAVTVPSTVKHLSREQSEINYIIELHRAVNHALSETERDTGRECVSVQRRVSGMLSGLLKACIVW